MSGTYVLSNGLDLSELIEYLERENCTFESEFGEPSGAAEVGDLNECISLLPTHFRVTCRAALQLESLYRGYEFDCKDSASNIKLSETGEITGISLSKLIEKITEEGHPELSNVALHTFLLFTSPRELLESLISRHNIPVPPLMSYSEATEFKRKKIQNMQSKFASIVKKWIKMWPAHFRDDYALTARLRNFLEELLESCPEGVIRANGDLILQSLDALGSPEPLKKLLFVDNRVPPPPILPKDLDFKTNDLLVWNSVEIARQLSLIESDLLKKVGIGELIGAHWDCADRAVLAPHVLKINERFIRARSLFIWSIVSQSELLNRVKIVKKLIEVADECSKNIHNYESPFIINSALKSDPVRGLVETMKEVKRSAAHKELLCRLEELYETSFKRLRAEMALSPLGIPCFLVLRQELKRTDSLNANFTQHGLVNVAKHAGTTAIIERIRLYQNHSLCFHRIRSLRTFLKAKNPPIEDQLLLEAAKKLEARP